MWTWEISTGTLYDDLMNSFAKGYSGFPPYTNDLSAQNKIMIGPIPEGNWTMTGVEENNPKLGPFVIVLEPDGETTVSVAAMGREPDTFPIHGERKEPPPGYASDGCIILPRQIREQIWSSTDHDLKVVGDLNEP
jgi:hypothetical protein